MRSAKYSRGKKTARRTRRAVAKLCVTARGYGFFCDCEPDDVEAAGAGAERGAGSLCAGADRADSPRGSIRAGALRAPSAWAGV